MGRFSRPGRVLAAVAPWALSSAIVTATFTQSFSAEALPIRTLVVPAKVQEPPAPKTEETTYEPWELVPT